MKIVIRGDTWTEKKRGTPEHPRRPLSQQEYRHRFIKNRINREHKDWKTYTVLSKWYWTSLFERWANTKYPNYRRAYEENKQRKNTVLARRARQTQRSVAMRRRW
jgi:hypothetical protein